MLQGNLYDETIMSNLTSATSNEASVSLTSNRSEAMGNNTVVTNTSQHPQQSLSDSLVTHQPPSKKKRNLPGNPDPEADVVALSPKSLMATNRFVCEVCNKGFQRDQNLQLHRRGHNLPWKLKQRNKNVVIKRKVYICPEPSCVHHDPSRALGDLTGIKKHFSRKHGEKKYKCDKCSKRYAVQSDWKAHSKICGTREYRCDCGTLFSRRDSFITHRAFCDALAEESSRSMTQQNPTLFSAPQSHHHIFHSNIQLKQETHLPPWLSVSSEHSPFFTPSSVENPNTNNNNPPNNDKIFPSSILNSPPPPASSSLMSATALLQKAAQMGVAMSTTNTPHQSSQHVGFCANTSSSNITAGMPSREGLIWHAKVTGGCMQPNNAAVNSSSFANFDMVNFDGILNNAKVVSGFQGESSASGYASAPGNNEGLTRDFLGLRAFPHDKNYFTTTINMAGLDQMGSSSYDRDQLQWQS